MTDTFQILTGTSLQHYADHNGTASYSQHSNVVQLGAWQKESTRPFRKMRLLLLWRPFRRPHPHPRTRNLISPDELATSFLSHWTTNPPALRSKNSAIVVDLNLGVTSPSTIKLYNNSYSSTMQMCLHLTDRRSLSDFQRFKGM